MKPAQNRFAAALRHLLETSDELTLSKLAERSRMAPGDLSHVKSGRRRITPAAIEKLANALEPQHGVPLVIAYLKDNVPPVYEEHIDIIARTMTLRDEPGEPGAPLSKYQRAIRDLASLEDVPALAKHIISTAETLGHLLKKDK